MSPGFTNRHNRRAEHVEPETGHEQTHLKLYQPSRRYSHSPLTMKQDGVT